MCGDGVLAAHERCDPPESCPTEQSCASDIPCVVVSFQGKREDCTASCQVTFISECTDGDGCCPQTCTRDSDADCSAVCGDGQVDEMNGETCEMSNPTARCLTSCDDDNPCTEDRLLGSERNCNVVCSYTALQQSAQQDGCCPASARGGVDGDCAALFHPSLQHRYRFTGTGTMVSDWVGSSDGMLVAGATEVSLSGNGTVQLTGGDTGPYVNLPNGLLSSQTSITLEAWVTLRSPVVDFARIFDFGSNDAGEDQQGGATSFLYLTPRSDLGFPRLGFSAVTTTRIPVDGTQAVPIDRMVHYAATYDAAAGQVTLYVDGVGVGSAAVEAPLSAISDENNWLGRSQYAGNEELRATYHEFRIYGEALTASEIASSHAAGPDPADR